MTGGELLITAGHMGGRKRAAYGWLNQNIVIHYDWAALPRSRGRDLWSCHW